MQRRLASRCFEGTDILNDNAGSVFFIFLRTLRPDPLQRFVTGHLPLIHQTFNLGFLGRSGYPDDVAFLSKLVIFQQLDRFHNDYRLGGALDDGIHCLGNKGMQDIFQVVEGFRIGKNQLAKLVAVNLTIGIQYPAPENIHDRLKARCSFGHCPMRKRVCINAISTKVLEHFSHDTFTGADIPG